MISVGRHESNFSLVIDGELETLKIGQFTFIGEFENVVYNGKLITKENLSVADIPEDESELLSFLQGIIGKCIVTKEDESAFLMYFSSSHPGAYYSNEGGKIWLSSDEKNVYQKAGSNLTLNELEALNIVVSHHGLRSPYSSLFKGVERVVGGCILKIGKDLQITRDLAFILDANKTRTQSLTREDEYLQIKNQLELNLKSLSTNERDNILLLSGGVDSCSLLIGLKNAKTSFRAVNWPLLEAQTVVANKVCKESGVELKVNKYGTKSQFSEDEKKKLMTQMYTRHVNIMSFWNSGSMELIGRCKEDQIFISGQNFDSLYFIDTYAPSFTANGLRYLIKLFVTMPSRFYNTITFFSYVLFKYKDKALHNYIDPIACSKEEHAVPFQKKKVFPSKYGQLDDKFANYKSEDLAQNFLKQVESKGYNQKYLTASQFSFLVKCFKWQRFVANTSANYFGVEQFVGLKRYLPILEGRMPHLLLRITLRLRDVFTIKPHLYKYYRQHFGRSHYNDRKIATLSTEPSNIRRNWRDFKRKLFGDKRSTFNPATIEEIKVLEDFYKETFKDDAPYLVKSIKDEDIKNYMNDLHKQGMNNTFAQLPKARIMELERFLNLNYFLAGVRKTSNDHA